MRSRRSCTRPGSSSARSSAPSGSASSRPRGGPSPAPRCISASGRSGPAGRSFRAAPSFRVRTPAFREFIRLMIPRMISHPIEPAIFTYFTVLASTIVVGGVSAVNFALDYQVVPVSLIGIAFSLAVFPTLSAAYADRDRATFGAVLGRNLDHDRRLHDARRDRPVRRLGRSSSRCCSAAASSARTMSPGPRPSSRRSRCRSRSTRSPIPCRAGLYATHDTIRQVGASFAGFGVVLLASTALVGPPRPAGHPAGLRDRDGRQGRAARGVPRATRPRDRAAAGRDDRAAARVAG